MQTKNQLLLAVVAIFSLLLITPASAGVLNGHASAYNDGNGPSAGAWTGSTPYDDGLFSLLTGDVDYAVFTAADFTAAFPASGYTPPAGHFVYAYQVSNTGSVAATALTVGITQGNPVGTIGTFSGGGVSGDASIGTQFTNNPVDSANWAFTGIGAGTSTGLVFSSPNVPENGFGSIVDSGLSAFVVPLPTPSEIFIPEPTSAVMLGLGMATLLIRRRS